MKKLVITTMATTLFTCLPMAGAQADTVKLVNKDGSSLSQLCVSAATSSESVFQLARELGINTLDLTNIACNGEPIYDFVRHQRKVSHEDSGTYSFYRGDSSMETELCIAAVTSPGKFEAMKSGYLSKTGTVGDSILCNSTPLNIFVKRYRSRELAAN